MDDAKLVIKLIFSVKANNKKIFHNFKGEITNLHLVVRALPGECFDSQILNWNNLNIE